MKRSVADMRDEMRNEAMTGKYMYHEEHDYDL
jgi:hypothetical protein